MMELLRDLDHDQGGTMMVPLRNFDPVTGVPSWNLLSFQGGTTVVPLRNFVPVTGVPSWNLLSC